MRSLVVLVLTLAVGVLHGGGPAEAGASGVRKSLRKLADEVRVRVGYTHRSLVVVCIFRKSPPETPSPACSIHGLAWPERAGGGLDVDGRAVAEDRVLPTGLIHRDGKRERLLATPVLVPVGRITKASWVRGPALLGESEPGIAGLAGPALRHTLVLAPHRDAVRVLLELERRIAGVEGAGPTWAVAAVRDAPRIRAPREEAEKALQDLPRAYGRKACGYVAFLGHRPIELVWARDPATYEAYAREAVPGLATYTALWEELYGRAGLPPGDKPKWPLVLEEAARVLQDVVDARCTKTKAKHRWRLHTKEAPRLGWAVAGDDDQVHLVEAWPLGDVGPFPVPAREPGGQPVNERPDGILGGTPTLAFLERYVERLKEIRRKMRER